MRPRNVTWELSLACNLNCQHCGSSAGKCRDDELSLERALTLCEELKELGTEECTLIGGEPFVSKKWYPLAKKCNEQGIKVNLVSNGTIMDDNIVRKLKETKVNNVGISVDGTEYTNNLIRGFGTYQKICRTIDVLQKNNIKTSVATTVSKLNFLELEDIYKNLVEMGVSVWQVQLAMPVGRMDVEYMLDKKDLRSLVEFIIKVNQEENLRIFPGCNVGYFGGLEEKYRTQREEENALPFWTGCYSGVLEMGIMSDGSVKGCLAMKDRFIEGNIKDESLKEIWEDENSFSYNRKFTKSSLEDYCSSCEYGEICRGGCPIISEALTGSTNNDPYCIERIEAEIISQ